METSLKKISVLGFKSIRNLDAFELNSPSLFIGGNGAGKSNFIGLFRILSAMTTRDGLNRYVAGSADDFLFGGAKTTEKIAVRLFFARYDYEFALTPTVDGFFLVDDEATYSYPNGQDAPPIRNYLGGGSFNSRLLDAKDRTDGAESVARRVYETLNSWKIYHFHDTSKEAGARRYQDCVKLSRLDSQADKIASFLYFLRTEFPKIYSEIVYAVRLAAPFFEDFVLEPTGDERIRLNWLQKGFAEYPMSPSQFSDGTLRFICLATALLQPNVPSTLLIDEPELGLHPAALGLLAELIQDASRRAQLIVATQSAALLDHFAPENVVVANRQNGETNFKRLDSADLKDWLETYSLGELWSRNVVAGGPVYE